MESKLVPTNAVYQINTNILSNNFQEVQKYVGSDVKIIAVIKANGYGAGLVESGKIFTEAGAAYLAVSNLNEGVALRASGIELPILVFTPATHDEFPIFIEHHILPTITNINALEAYSSALGEATGGFQLKVNTGMNRFGADACDVPSIITTYLSLNNLILDGVYSHLAISANKKTSQKQLDTFREILADIEHLYSGVFTTHLVASNGILTLPEGRFSCVRAGSILYGQTLNAPSFGIKTADPYVLKARIIETRNVAKGAGIGYGFDMKAKGDMQLGVLALGYFEGIGLEANTRTHTTIGAIRAAAQLLLGRGKKAAYYNGKTLPVIGRIAMGSTIIDITNTNLQVGDWVEIRCRKILVNRNIRREYI